MVGHGGNPPAAAVLGRRGIAAQSSVTLAEFVHLRFGLLVLVRQRQAELSMHLPQAFQLLAMRLFQCRTVCPCQVDQFGHQPAGLANHLVQFSASAPGQLELAVQHVRQLGQQPRG